MKLKEWNSSNQKTRKDKTCFINFHKKGMISFSSGLFEKLNLSAGDKITLLQDEENPKDFYLSTNTTNGITLRKIASGALMANLVSFTTVLFEELKNLIPENKESIRLKVSTSIHEGMYAILTRELY